MLLSINEIAHIGSTSNAICTLSSLFLFPRCTLTSLLVLAQRTVATAGHRQGRPLKAFVYVPVKHGASEPVLTALHRYTYRNGLRPAIPANASSFTFGYPDAQRLPSAVANIPQALFQIAQPGTGRQTFGTRSYFSVFPVVFLCVPGLIPLRLPSYTSSTGFPVSACGCLLVFECKDGMAETRLHLSGLCLQDAIMRTPGLRRKYFCLLDPMISN